MKPNFPWVLPAATMLVVAVWLFQTEGHRMKREEPAVSARPTLGREVPPGSSVFSSIVSLPPQPTDPSASLPASNSPAKRMELHRRFGSILRQLGLSQTEIDRFVELRLRILEAYSDLNAGIENAGARGGTVELEQLRDDLTRPFWNEIRQLMGEEKFAAFRDHEQMASFRLMVSALFTTARIPISDEQLEQVARNALRRSLTGVEYPTNPYAWLQVDWNVAIRDSESCLTLSQLAVLYDHAAYRAWRKTQK